MKSYTITVNGTVYDVTVEEKAGGAAAPAAPPAAAAAEKPGDAAASQFCEKQRAASQFVEIIGGRLGNFAIFVAIKREKTDEQTNVFRPVFGGGRAVRLRIVEGEDLGPVRRYGGPQGLPRGGFAPAADDRRFHATGR